MSEPASSDSRHKPYGLDDLQAELRLFREERDWSKFHDPKSLILALVGEVGELAELFQWIPAHDAVRHFTDAPKRQRAAEEMSDILIYLLGLADVLEVDLLDAARRKVAASRQRFPADELRGVAPEKT